MHRLFRLLPHVVCVVPALCALTCAAAQNVSPVISEYTSRASGSFEVTNNTLSPSIVMLEPKSFSIRPDGEGEFRTLDSGIHLDISTTSLRLEPHQSAHIFYKVTADNVPAWLCIYASFSPVKKAVGINVRIMLPHTIYLYQQKPLQEGALEVGAAHYDPELHRVDCELTNNSESAGRAQSVEITGKRDSMTIGGFPMLPHERRIVSAQWKSEGAPQKIEVQFEHFSLRRPIIESIVGRPQE